MRHMMARYEVDPKQVDSVKKAITKFVSGIRQEPGTVSYQAFQMTGTTFVHFMVFRDEKAQKAHAQSTNTKQFVDVLYPKCIEKPVFTELGMLGSARGQSLTEKRKSHVRKPSKKKKRHAKKPSGKKKHQLQKSKKKMRKGKRR